MTNSDRQLELQSLDVAIAERLGIAPKISWEILNEDESASMIGFENEAQARWWLSQREYLQSTHHVGTWKIYPPYSSDISSAMKVEDRIAELGKQESYCWHLGMVVAEAFKDSGQAPDIFDLIHATPEQRCRAALAALEGK